jgi:multidrug efflux pump subunit AcrB
MVAVAAGLWKFTPGSLVPDEDQGFYIAVILLPDGSSLERTDAMVQKVVTTVKENPNIENAVAFTGMDFIGGGVFRNNAATIFFTMKHWDERKVPAQALVGEFFGRTGGFKEGLAIAFNAPPIFALGRHRRLRDAPAEPRRRRREAPRGSRADVHHARVAGAGHRQAQMFWRPNVPQLFVDVDREKAKALGVPIDEVFNALARRSARTT